MRRRFEFQEGNSSKFWEVEVDGSTVTTWWGKIGTSGQSKAKDFGTPAKAQHEYDKLVAEKTGKGYEEVSGGATSTATPKPATPVVKAAPVHANVQPRAQSSVSATTTRGSDENDDNDDGGDADEADEADEADGASAGSGRRRFEFEEGNSCKFWEVAIEGAIVTTWWGKIGTSGQSKAKDFGTASKAQHEYDKLVDEKTGKGYEEVDGCGAGGAVPKAPVPTAKAITAKTPPAKASASKKQVDEDEDEDDDGAGISTSKSGRRRFEFEEGNSSKFWEIAIEDTNVTTWWGRLGTSGQSKSLQFGTAAEAQNQYEKLVVEKTKKGYEEVGSGAGGGFEIPPEWKPYARPAWKPVTKDGDGPPDASKFSGIPWLVQGESWPRCEGCEEPLQHFVQLSLPSLPDEVKNKFGTSGLLQLFYCCDPDCEDEHSAYFGNQTTMVVRVVEPTGSCGSPAKSEVQDPFPAKLIKGWTKLPVEYPTLGELEEMGMDVDELIDQEIDAEVYPYPNDKLYGWPAWVQGVEYGVCKECNEPMQLVFQIGSEDNLPLMFGDCGVAHITQCSKHRDQFKFGWACS